MLPEITIEFAPVTPADGIPLSVNAVDSLPEVIHYPHGATNLYPVAPQAEKQVVYVNFNGGTGLSFRGQRANGEELTADDISVADAGHSQEEIDYILSELNARFAGSNIEFVDTPPEDAGTPYSTIFVGATDVFEKLGMSVTNPVGIYENVEPSAGEASNAFVPQEGGLSQEIDSICRAAGGLFGGSLGSGSTQTPPPALSYRVTYITGSIFGFIFSQSPDSLFQCASTADVAGSVGLRNGATVILETGGRFQNVSISAGARIFCSGTIDTVTVNDGWLFLYDGASIGSATVSGGIFRVLGGETLNTTVTAGGVMSLEAGLTSDGSAANGSASGVRLVSGGILQINGGYGSDTQVSGGGILNVFSGIAENSVVSSGGVQNVIQYGSAAGTFLYESGVQNVYSGAAVENVLFAGGTQFVLSAGSVTGMNVDNGLQAISGGIARATVVGSSGRQSVLNGGMADSTRVASGGVMHVAAGGTAENATVDYGGLQTVSSGGVISGDNVIGGSMHLWEGAITEGATVILDMAMRQTSDGVMINDLELLDAGIGRVRTSGGLASGVYRLAGMAALFGSALDIDFEGGGSAVIGGFGWLAGAKRYSGATEDDVRYVIGYADDNLVLSAHQRYELLDNGFAEAIADDISYTDVRGGASSGYYARLTSGRSYADVYGGGSLNDVTGKITLAVENGASLSGSLYGGGSGKSVGSTELSVASGATVAGIIVGGGNGGNVTGDVSLTVRGNATGVAGGGLNANVNGKVTLDFDGTFTGRGFVAGGGLSGNVGTAGNTGAAIDMTVAISSYDVNNSFKIIGGSYATTVYGGDTTVYGGINLKLNDAGAVGSQLTELVCGGSFREQVAGTSTVTGDVSITANGFVQNNLMFGGGIARAATAGTVNSIVEGGVTIDLTDIQFTTSLLALGGYSNGQRTYTQVGTSSNLAGGSISIQGSSTRMAAVAGGGYAIGGGRSVVYGDVSITMTGDGMTGPQIYGGGYCNNGVVINYGKSTITVDGNSPTSNIWGGGLVYASSRAFLTQGVEINISGGYNSSITRIFGGGRSVNAGDTSVGFDENYDDVSSSIGTNISIDSTVTVGNVYGGGYQLGAGWTGVSGGTHITIDGGTAANVFGGGYSESTLAGAFGDEVNGGSSITVNGGSVHNVYGGGHGYSTTGTTTVNGGSYIMFNSKDLTVDIGGYVYGGGLYRSTVNGGSTIEFTGLGSNLVFSEVEGGYVCGSGNSNKEGRVNGTKHLKFTDFTGNFDAWLDQFDTVTLAGSQVTWTAPQDYMKTVSTWNFEVFEGETTLEWQSGSNHFDNDALNLSFETSGFTGGTVIEGSSAAIFTGWNNTSNTVTFNGTAGSWNSGLNAWVSTDDTWKLYLDGNSLKLGLA